MTEGDRPVDQDKPADNGRPFWALNSDEQRLLWITFLGGFGAIVAGAVFIGGAVAFARIGTPPSKFSWQGWFAAIFALVASVGTLVGLLWLLRNMRETWTRGWLRRIVVIVAVLVGALWPLIWVGWAVGIK